MQDFETMRDEELVSLSIEDKEAFYYLVRRYESAIKRYLKRIGSFHLDALDDILQEIFVKVYLNLNGFDQTLKFSSWIYRIAHNEAINYFRKNKKHEDAVFLPDEDLENISNGFLVEKEHEDLELKKAISESISELKEKYRDILILKFVEGKDYEEISDILRIPVGTVGVQIKRGKEQLKEILIKKGYIL